MQFRFPPIGYLTLEELPKALYVGEYIFVLVNLVLSLSFGIFHNSGFKLLVIVLQVFQGTCDLYLGRDPAPREVGEAEG